MRLRWYKHLLAVSFAPWLSRAGVVAFTIPTKRYRHIVRPRHLLNVHDDNWQKPLNTRSIAQILEELDEKGIRYPPTATRRELESLLKSGEVALHNNRDQQTNLDIKDLLEKLEQRGIRYEPTDSRQKLEYLLEQKNNTAESFEDKESPLTAATEMETSQANHVDDPLENANENHRDQGQFTTKRPIVDLLNELDSRRISYSPTATRNELETLLQKDQAPRDSPTKSTTRDDATEAQQLSSKRLSIKQILDELDSQGVMYPPTATRKELESLLAETQGKADGGKKLVRKYPESSIANHRIEDADSIEDSKSSRAAPTAREPLPRRPSGRDTTRERQKRRRERQEANQSMLSYAIRHSARSGARRVAKLSRNSRSRLSKVAEKAVKKAKRATRRAVEWWDEEDGEKNVRDADYSYVAKRDAPIDVKVVDAEIITPQSNRQYTEANVYRRQRKRRQPSSQQMKSTSRVQSQDISSANVRKRTGSRGVTDESSSTIPTRMLPPTSQDTVSFILDQQGEVEESESIFHLHEEDNGGSPTPEQLSSSGSRPRPRPNAEEAKKRIYSPYDRIEPDGLEKFGEALADAAENMLWGSQDQDTAKETDTSSKTQPQSKKRKKRPRYWKDRLAERLDYALGIHDDENVYDSWEKEAEQARQTPRGNDPISNIMDTYSRQRPRPRPPNSKSRKDKSTPFWEEEGNIISVLFGRTAKGNNLTFERFLDNADGVHVMTTLFRSVIKSTLLVASYACRWASVRGAVPQPIVVFGITAAALTARPRRRLWTVGLTLVAMRTVGEMIHGYIYGDQDWEANDEITDQKDEPNKRKTSDRDDYVEDEGDSWEGDGL